MLYWHRWHSFWDTFCDFVGYFVDKNFIDGRVSCFFDTIKVPHISFQTTHLPPYIDVRNQKIHRYVYKNMYLVGLITTPVISLLVDLYFQCLRYFLSRGTSLRTWLFVSFVLSFTGYIFVKSLDSKSGSIFHVYCLRLREQYISQSETTLYIKLTLALAGIWLTLSERTHKMYDVVAHQACFTDIVWGMDNQLHPRFSV